MKKCPDCNNNLMGVDTRGMFAFEKRAARIFWLISFVFLVLLWSILIQKIVPETFRPIALVIYYSLGAILIYKTYNSNKNKIIYECISCKKKFKGNALTQFNYGEPETKI
jgi:hypothetical protein